MKNLYLLLSFLFFSCYTLAQEKPVPHVLGQQIGKLTFLLTTSTPNFALNDLNSITAKKMLNLSFGQLSLKYRLNDHFSIGLSTIGELSHTKSGFYDQENRFNPYCDDDDMDDGDADDDQGEDDDCDDDFGSNLMANVTYRFSENFPVFIELAGGYSLSGQSPAYSGWIAYSQKVYRGMALLSGLRISSVLHKKPGYASSSTNAPGLKLELGVAWDFNK